MSTSWVRRERRLAASMAFEQLEWRQMLAFDPSAQAQEMLEHVNRMRMNPQAELQVLFTNLNPLTARDPDANSSIAYFNDPTSSSIQSEWASLQPVAPLAWNESLSVAAIGHSQAMIDQDSQSHQLPGEPDLVVRMKNAGYSNLSSAGENVFAYSKNVFNAHSGFAIDWAVSGRGHRSNIMNSGFREFGVGMLAENSPATKVGPLVVTQNFGNRFNTGNAFLLGVVYSDANGNQRYDAGEGLGGATIQVTGPGGSFTTTTMSAGGYQIQVPVGTYTVTATGAGLAGNLQRGGVQVAAANVKVDFGGRSSGSTGSLPATPSAVIATAGIGQVTLNWTSPASNNSAPITDYVIQYGVNGSGTWTTFTRAASAATSATVTGLIGGTRYVFRVAAVNAAGTGAFSAVSNAVTPTGSGSSPVPTPPPTSPVVIYASVSGPSASVTEGAAAVFTITLSQPSTKPAQVGFRTVSGSATAGRDFTNATGFVTFAPGETTKTVSVSTINDSLGEAAEWLTLQLVRRPGPAQIGTGSARATIAENDGGGLGRSTASIALAAAFSTPQATGSASKRQSTTKF
ncbi:MAG: fibronectin type III domain-containing protein [Planctomycetota bacterium]